MSEDFNLSNEYSNDWVPAFCPEADIDENTTAIFLYCL
jgi:hypothetical protein